MTVAERDAFLAEERTCRVATTSTAGPHVTPLWFHWDGHALWLTSLFGSQRWLDLERDPRVAVIVDTGHDYDQLRGVELRGTARPVGERPRTGLADPELVDVEREFSRKYTGQPAMRHDGRHAWLQVVPSRVTSWDFRKLGRP